MYDTHSRQQLNLPNYRKKTLGFPNYSKNQGKTIPENDRMDNSIVSRFEYSLRKPYSEVVAIFYCSYPFKAN